MVRKLDRLWIGLISKEVREDRGKITVSGTCVLGFPREVKKPDLNRISIDLPARSNAFKVRFGMERGIPIPMGCFVNTYRFEIEVEDAKALDIQNKLVVNYDNHYIGNVFYSLQDLKKGKNKNSPLFIHDNVTMYFRQNKNNRMFLVVRDTCRYDYEDEQKRIESAKKKALNYKNDDIILLFEKKCQKYEESASVLYEKLIDMGYENAYFIVDQSIPAVQNLDEKYKKNLIDKDSDKHLEYFFASNKFISTETIDHALQLRIANKAAQDKINADTKDMMYVFLQHGPTYMVSLNKDLRNGFRKKANYKLHKTVVSSELEAEHFMELGGMNREDLYITGMAKFDRAYRYEGADRIVIMPTWRRWETNQAREDITKTNYYAMVRLMYDSVPEHFRNKVIILPHPLMAERFKDLSLSSDESELGSHILMADSYDEVLRNCDVLVTDYSSISYDAFYRGAKVIFYWAEKDECMTHYGEGTHLMLNMDNVFGPVAMSGGEIRKALVESYGREQDGFYLSRYRKIIEFHDGRNTERIIAHLIEDRFLQKH